MKWLFLKLEQGVEPTDFSVEQKRKSINQQNFESFKTFNSKSDTDVKEVKIETEATSSSFLGQISQEVQLSDLKGITDSKFFFIKNNI